MLCAVGVRRTVRSRDGAKKGAKAGGSEVAKKEKYLHERAWIILVRPRGFASVRRHYNFQSAARLCPYIVAVCVYHHHLGW